MSGVGGPIPVLVVDDRQENLTAMQALLSGMDLDLDLVLARTGNAALLHSLKRDFALVLLDMQMPDMDDMETATLLRANPKTCHVPVVFVTAGMSDPAHMLGGYALGAVDYLIKPIEPLILRGKVRALCDLYAQRVEIEYHRAHLDAAVQERTRELSALARELGVEVEARRASEAALRQLNDNLELRVEERTRELRRAMDQIVESEKLASLGRIVAGVAHELNTPIGNVVVMASTLEELMAELGKAAHEGRLTKSGLVDTVKQGQNASQLIVRSGQRAGELIESFKKVAVDQTSQRRRRFDLRELVGDILTTLGTELRRAQVSGELRIAPGIEMDSYPGDLEQIFNNLIMNTLRHGCEPRGGGQILIEGRRTGGMVEIRYQDDGIGIAPELHRKVFEPFYTTRLGQGGSGLGLFIVHNLVHGVFKGELQLDSEPGHGMRLNIRMPAVTP